MSERIATVEDLVAAREARGLGADDVMRQLKLAPRQLQALEHGDWGALPGHAFVRGMLRAYGRMLGVDVEPLVEAMSSTVRAADLRPAASLDEPLPSRSMMGFGSGGSGSRVAWTVLLAVGVLALALFFGGANLGSVGSWLARDAAQGTDSATGQDAPADAGPAGTTTETVPLGPLTPAPTDSAPAEGAPPAAPVSPSSGAPGSGSAANLAAAAAPTGTLASMSMVAQPAAGQGAAPDGTASADAGASASPTLRLVFERDAWIEARRDGKVILSGTQAAGSAREVPIDGRTALVIGNAASVRAEFAGKPLDLATHTRGSIARLSLP